MQVRYITKRGAGRESVKTVDIDKDVLIIGRATGCDIELPDLLVALRHARLSVAGKSVVIESEGDHMFKAGGRLVKRVEWSLDQPRIVEIGPFILTIAAAGASFTVDVARNERTVSRAVKRDVSEVFKLTRSLYSIRTAAWLLALIVGVVMLAFPLVTFALDKGRSTARIQAGQMWVTGGMSSSHASLAADCESCHENEFVSVRDDTCLSCHKDTRHHAEPERMAKSNPEVTGFERVLQRVSSTFDRPPERCASCHMEHNGKDGLVSTAQSDCADCHENLDTRLTDTALLNASDFGKAHPNFHPTLVAEPHADTPKLTTEWDITTLDAARAAREELIGRQNPGDCDGFEIGQPNFRGLAQLGERPGGVPAAAMPGDNSGLVFPHAVHLDKKGCVTALAVKLGAKAGYNGALECADCHTPDGGGVLFNDVRMEENCSACHSLAFEKVNGFTRTLRHGEPEDVIGSMLDFYQAKVVARTFSAPLAEERRRPGEASASRYSNYRALSFANAGSRAEERVKAIFSRGGACYGCHEIKQPSAPGGIDYGVKPVTLQDQFLPRGAFNHRAHETANLECAECHKAETSQTSADVLLPAVAVCQDCHKGERTFAAVPSTCTMCHEYHSSDDALPVMKPSVKQSARARRPWSPDLASAMDVSHPHAP